MVHGDRLETHEVAGAVVEFGVVENLLQADTLQEALAYLRVVVLVLGLPTRIRALTDMWTGR